MTDERSRMSEEQIVIRLPRKLLNLIDYRVAKLQARRPGRRVTRSEVVRDLLSRTLKAHASGA